MATADPFLVPPSHTNGINGTNGAHHEGPLDTSPSAFDSTLLRSYLLALLPPLLGAGPEDLYSVFDDDFEERVARFASEGNGVMYVSKLKHEIEGTHPLTHQSASLVAQFPLDDVPPSFTYHLNTQLNYSAAQVMTVALIKRTPILDPTSPFATQIHVLNLFGGDDTPYESLHAVVSSGVKPWFEAFVGSRGAGKEGDSKMGSSWFL